MTSVPYLAVPLVFGGLSSCGTETPTMVYWSGVFSLIALSSSGVKVLVILPLLTMSAKLIDFFDFGCETVELRTTSSPAGTPIDAAAASVNAIRPAAPARLMESKFIIVLQLPPVICAPSTGSLNFGSLEASWTRMSFQDEPSSSETICAMVEAICWPISALPQVTVTRPSGPIEYQVDGSKLEGAANAWSMPGTAAYPSTRPVAAEPTRNERRLRSVGAIFTCVFMWPSARCRRWRRCAFRMPRA